MASPDVQSMLSRQVVYDGEDYTRQGIEQLVQAYSTKHQKGLQSLEELSLAHEQLSREMTADVLDQKSAWEHVRNVLVLNNVSSNLQGLAEKLPVLRSLIPPRPLGTLLAEKVEVAQRRTQQVGSYLDRIQSDIRTLQEDIGRLNEKMLVAARNEESAANVVLELKTLLDGLQRQLDGMGDKGTAQARELQTQVDQVKSRIWEHGAKLRLFATAESRISSIIRMNNNFLEILRNLHGNMQSLYDAGTEVLSELEGHLAGLAGAARASELSMDLKKSMDSLRSSVNKVATLASETSLYLTKNAARLTQEMHVYDKATEQLVEDNLRAEREIQEQRVNETITFAEKELQALKESRRA